MSGKRSKKRLIGSIGGSMTLLAVLVAAMVSTGTVMAAIGPAIGGFTASFDHVQGSDGATIYPSLGSASACSEDDVPLLTADIPSATVEGVNFKKFIETPDVAGFQNVTINITQNDANGTATLNNLDMQLAGLNSSKVELGNVSGKDNATGSVGIYDNKTTNESEKFGGGDTGFKVSSEGHVLINGGKAFAQLVTFDGASFDSGLKIGLDYGDEGPNTSANPCA